MEEFCDVATRLFLLNNVSCITCIFVISLHGLYIGTIVTLFVKLTHVGLFIYLKYHNKAINLWVYYPLMLC